MTASAIQQQHSDNILRAVERQRNDALTREAQKDAIIQILQQQLQAMSEKLKAAAAASTDNAEPPRKSKKAA